MRIDPSAQKPATPVKSVPWDNQELRNRLQGRQVEATGLSELQSIARDKASAPDEPRRGRRRSK
ncbi:MAG TPA: hypothetical protein VK646_02900 [Actinomycetota bacterium]|nr:hypothetical protein [Actinomycetota bacterium]